MAYRSASCSPLERSCSVIFMAKRRKFFTIFGVTLPLTVARLFSFHPATIRGWYRRHGFRRVPNSLPRKGAIDSEKGQFLASPLFTFSIKKLTRLSCFANLDFVTQVFDSTRQALRGSLLIDACEIECSEIAVRHLIAQ